MDKWGNLPIPEKVIQSIWWITLPASDISQSRYQVMNVDICPPLEENISWFYHLRDDKNWQDGSSLRRQTLINFGIHYHEVYAGGYELRTGFLQGMPVPRTRYLSPCGFPFARSFRTSWTSFLTRPFLKMRCSRWQTTSFLMGLNFREVACLSLTSNRKCIYTYLVKMLPVALPTSFAGLLQDSRTKAQLYKSRRFDRLDPLYRPCLASKRTCSPPIEVERLKT